MEHAEARELLEVAAVEPGGFARLVAGDTRDAAALAGHLAGCPECSAELERLRRSAAVIRDTVRLMPSPELRGQTLAYVAALGRPRGTADVPAVSDVASAREVPVARRTMRALPLPRPALWVASLAAAIVIAVAGTVAFGGASRDRQIAEQAEEIEALHDVAAWTIRVDRQADARHVTLAGTATGGASGTLIFSPSSTEVVVVATNLAPPAAGTEYRCWVETGGRRERVGRMFVGAGLAYWVGKAPSLSGLGGGSTFGISIVPANGDSIAGDPVLTGRS
jgi:hypothetical protein